MRTRNYYLILGIPRNESPAGVRSAYRDLVKQHHPDRAGPEGKETFQSVTEAYETLCDPEKRRRYDDTLEREDIFVRSRRSETLAEERIQPEPLIPRRDRGVSWEHRLPISILSEPESIQPSADALLERFVRNFTGMHVPKAERLEALTVEIVLSSDDAEIGVEVPIGVPTYRYCTVCRGTGYDFLFPCLRCESSGVLEDEKIIRVQLPPFTKDGEIIEIPLAGIAVRNLWLRIRIRVL